MIITNASYGRARPTSVGSVGLHVESLKTKCKELISRAYIALEKPNGYRWVVSKLFDYTVLYNALISMPIRETKREITLRRRLRSLQDARMGRWNRTDRSERKQMLLKRIDEILVLKPDYHELKTLKQLVRYAK